MPRVTHVKKARKAVKSAGIRVGDSYYWWKFRNGPKRYSKTAPCRSQLTQSSFLAAIYDIEDDIAEISADEDIQSHVEDVISRLRDLADECEGNRSNMPESLQEADTGQLLADRAEACTNAADELESIDFNGFDGADAESEARDEDPDADPETIQDAIERKRIEYWEGKLEEVQNVSIDLP